MSETMTLLNCEYTDEFINSKKNNLLYNIYTYKDLKSVDLTMRHRHDYINEKPFIKNLMIKSFDINKYYLKNLKIDYNNEYNKRQLKYIDKISKCETEEDTKKYYIYKLYEDFKIHKELFFNFLKNMDIKNSLLSVDLCINNRLNNLYNEICENGFILYPLFDKRLNRYENSNFLSSLSYYKLLDTIYDFYSIEFNMHFSITPNYISYFNKSKYPYFYKQSKKQLNNLLLNISNNKNLFMNISVQRFKQILKCYDVMHLNILNIFNEEEITYNEKFYLSYCNCELPLINFINIFRTKIKSFIINYYRQYKFNNDIRIGIKEYILNEISKIDILEKIDFIIGDFILDFTFSYIDYYYMCFEDQEFIEESAIGRNYISFLHIKGYLKIKILLNNINKLLNKYNIDNINFSETDNIKKNQDIRHRENLYFSEYLMQLINDIKYQKKLKKDNFYYEIYDKFYELYNDPFKSYLFITDNFIPNEKNIEIKIFYDKILNFINNNETYKTRDNISNKFLKLNCFYKVYMDNYDDCIIDYIIKILKINTYRRSNKFKFRFNINYILNNKKDALINFLNRNKRIIWLKSIKYYIKNNFDCCICYEKSYNMKRCNNCNNAIVCNECWIRIIDEKCPLCRVEKCNNFIY